jgi:hypothetical protein|tara:strand:- start:240 stop:362 length:123 start_codon:yes stop_codon:yes gene_type:complete
LGGVGGVAAARAARARAVAKKRPSAAAPSASGIAFANRIV